MINMRTSTNKKRFKKAMPWVTNWRKLFPLMTICPLYSVRQTLHVRKLPLVSIHCFKQVLWMYFKDPLQLHGLIIFWSSFVSLQQRHSLIGSFWFALSLSMILNLWSQIILFESQSILSYFEFMSNFKLWLIFRNFFGLLF
jgi:hypothetical protein